jgi:transposase
MARRPSADFCERWVAALDAGLPLREAAPRFRVSIRTLSLWRARGESLVVHGTVDGAVCVAFVERGLVPSLRPGPIVVLANLSVHKSKRAQALIEQAGCRVVFLPSSSPDGTPIALAFAKAKQARRRLEARSWESIVTAIGAVLPAITAADARAFFVDAGFPLP